MVDGDHKFSDKKQKDMGAKRWPSNGEGKHLFQLASVRGGVSVVTLHHYSCFINCLCMIVSHAAPCSAIVALSSFFLNDYAKQ